MKLPLKCDYYHFYINEDFSSIKQYSYDEILKKLKNPCFSVEEVMAQLDELKIPYKYIFDKNSFEEDTEAFFKEFNG